MLVRVVVEFRRLGSELTGKIRKFRGPGGRVFVCQYRRAHIVGDAYSLYFVINHNRVGKNKAANFYT